jgi:hypothetical protein
MANSAFSQSQTGVASTTSQGIVEVATTPQFEASTDTGETGAPLIVTPSQIQTAITSAVNTAVGGLYPWFLNWEVMSGSGTGNVYGFTGDDIFFANYSNTTLHFKAPDTIGETRAVNLDCPGTMATLTGNVVYIGGSVYVVAKNGAATPDQHYVIKYDASNLAAGGTVCTFSGAFTLATSDTLYPNMSTDGTNWYFMYKALNSANSYDLARYTLSGSTFTYVDTISLGSSDITTFAAMPDGTFYAQSTTGILRKFDASGTQTAASTNGTYAANGSRQLGRIGSALYSGCVDAGMYQRIV